MPDSTVLEIERNFCEILLGFDQNSLQEFDDYGILMKFFKDFDQNSGCQENLNQYSDQKIR